MKRKTQLNPVLAQPTARGRHALAVNPRKETHPEKEGRAQRKNVKTRKTRNRGGERGGGGPPKLESSMATYDMLSSFAAGFFVLARQAAYVWHIENEFEQN